MALPPPVLILKDTVYPAIRDTYATTKDVLQDIEDEVIDPAVSAIIGLPETVASSIGDFEIDIGVDSYNVYDIMTGDNFGTESRTRDTLKRWMGIDRREREVSIVEGNNISNQVTLIPGSGDPAFGRRTMFDMLATDGDLTSGYTELQGEETTIFAPFSIYFPSSMWPYASEDGSRYTVHDLGNEEIESDFLGTKPLIEIAMGRKLDKVGALPAFGYWGDIALGATPTVLYGGLGIGAILTAEFWGPPLVQGVTGLVGATLSGTAEIGYAFAKGLRNLVRI